MLPEGEKPTQSPFSELLSSNSPPPDQAIVHIRTFVDHRRAEALVLDKEIEDLQRALKARFTERSALSTAIAAHESLFNPIRRVPGEVLQEIFTLCRPWHRLPTMGLRDAPLLLTRVCRAWRDLALKTPRLWDRIHIALPGEVQEEVLMFHLERAERWLDRAGQLPLSISIWSQFFATPTGGMKAALQRTILDRAPHVEHLELEVPKELLNVILGTLPSTSWSGLQTVTVTGVHGATDFLRPYPAYKLQVWKAPKLKGVVWQGVDSDYSELPLQWGKMEEIAIDKSPGPSHRFGRWATFSAPQVRRLLQETPNVRSLRISLNDGSDDEDFGASYEPHLTLSHLTSLALGDLYIRHNMTQFLLLGGLQLPALETLSYKLSAASPLTVQDPPVAPMPSTDSHPLVLFLRAQEQPIRIKSFKIHHMYISNEGLLECLMLMPCLERLWIWHEYQGGFQGSLKDRTLGVVADKTFLRALVPLCPFLTRLRVDYLDAEFQDVKDFVQDRLAFAHSSRHPSEPRQSPAPASKATSFPRLQRLLVAMANECLHEEYTRDNNPWENEMREMGVWASITFPQWHWSPSLFSLSKSQHDPHEGMPSIGQVDADWD